MTSVKNKIPARKKNFFQRIAFDLRRNPALYLMLVLPVAVLVIYSYMPLYGLRMAFQRFVPAKGMFGDQKWVGMKWFTYLFTMNDFWYALKNTLILAVSKMALTTLASITFALLMNELQSERLKKTVSTALYLPHFISWIILAGIFVDLLSLSGPINQVIMSLGFSPINFLGSNDYFRGTMILTDVWKEFGFGTIIYMATITGIDPALYEAARIDGANRWQQTWHVTLPGMSSIIALLALLNIGGVLSGNFDQVFNMYSPVVYRTGDILDTLVYRIGLVDFNFSLSTAVGLFRSLIGLVLTGVSYGLAWKFAGYRIF